MRNIYLLYGCDQWKMTASQYLIMATTNAKKIRRRVAHEIKTGNMEYRGESGTNAAREFMSSEHDTCDHSLLTYGCVESYFDGEIVDSLNT